MRKIKKALSLILVLSMILGMSLNVGAADVTTKAQTEQTAGQDKASVENKDADEPSETDTDTPADADKATESKAVKKAEVSTDKAATANADAKAVSDDEPTAQANTTTGTKPADGTTSNQPFPTDIGVGHYRIPALMTVGDNLVAAADARWGIWQQPDDCANIDTIVSRSGDKGASWSYTFANYIADNGNERDFKAATFIDPALAYDSSNSTLYMIVDLFPGQSGSQNCSMAAQVGTGFDSNGNLLLKGNANASSYDYYLKEGKIYQVSGDTVVEGYTVDEYFNLSQNGTVLGNLFTYSTTYFQPRMTSYLYLTKSTDGGATWSAPTLLNLKNDTEKDYLISPGRGMVTSDGTIVFPCYTYTGSKASIIYSKDNGATWTRSEDASFNSSEGDLVELEDGTLRYFYRHSTDTSNLRYVDITESGDGYSFGSAQTVNGVSVHSDCNLSAISYSKKIDGEQAILVSCPTSGRTTGKIFTFTVESDKTLKKVAEYSVNGSNAFSYSSMTELSDGSIGILYEKGDSGNITYANLGISTVASGVTFDSEGGETDKDTDENTGTTETKDITIYVGQSKTVTDSTGNYKNSYTGSGLNTSIATVSVKGNTVAGGEKKVLGSTVSMNSNDTYKGVISDGTNYLVLNNGTVSSTTDINQATEWTVTRSGKYFVSYTIQSDGYYLSRSNNSQVTVDKSKVSWDYSDGFYYSSWGSSYYLRTDNGTWQVSTTNSNNGQLYSVKTQTTEAVDATDITITGVAVGQTSVVVGNTRYNITVEDVPPVVDMDTTPFVNSDRNKLTGLVTSVGVTYDIDLASGISSNGTWSSEDTSIATVDQDGKVTGVSAGETTLTYTVGGVAYTIPVRVIAGSGSTSGYLVTAYNDEVTNCTSYYSIDYEEPVEYPVGTQVYYYFTSSSGTIITFFATPDEGYALTYCNATGGSYFHQVRTDDGSTYSKDITTASSGGYVYLYAQLMNNAGAVWRDAAKMAPMLNKAVEYKCDGGFFFSRNANSGSAISCGITTFRAEKLPTVEKKVTSVDGATYTPGMTVTEGQEITFTISVTQYAPSSSYSGNNITYNNEKLTEKLNDAKFSDGTTETTPTLSDKALSQNTTTTYTVTYTVKESDLDTTITNTVDLTYTYVSGYSKGSRSAAANAEAKISAPTFTPSDIIIDFGLPVMVDYSGNGAHGRYDLASGTAGYGEVTVDGNKVTYKPTQTLKDVDTVTLTNTAGGTYAFKVYPATTVYYEESFATLEGFEKIGTASNTAQTTQIAGKSKDAYGYDAAYADDEAGASNGTYVTSSVKGSTATFSFTGTGVDLYVNSGKDTGNIAIQVRDKDNKLVKVATVQTTSHSTIADTFDNTDEANLIAASVMGLPHGAYTVKVTTTNDAQVNFDGFRVYGTLKDQNNEVYKADKEDDPTYMELRDYVLTALRVDNELSSAEVYAQIREKTGGQLTGVVLTQSSNDSQYSGEDLLENGPKNELFLLPNESVTFKINTNRVVQIGLKAPVAQTSYQINDGSATTINTSTDMFYTALNNADSESEKTVTITNEGDSLLSVTKVKVCDDPNASFSELTEEDIEKALEYMNASSETDEPDEPDTPDDSNGSEDSGNHNKPETTPSPITIITQAIHTVVNTVVGFVKKLFGRW